MRRDPVTAAAFEALFEPSVRAFFNFDRMRAERWPISIRVLTDRQDLAAVTLPWSPDTRRHGPKRRRYTVKRAAADLHHLDDYREAVLEQAADLASAESVPVYALPAALVDGELLLLDGSHPAVAAYLTGRVAFVVFAVRVPSADWAIVD